MSGPRYFRTRHFTNIVGSSSKFWSIRMTQNAGYTVRFGRIGTGGQIREKQFETQWEAQKAAGRIIQQKLDKGYLENGEVVADSIPMEAPDMGAVRPKVKRPKKRKTVKKAVKVEPVGRVISFEKEE